MYEVVWGFRKGKKFDTLPDAIECAKERVREMQSHSCPLIYDESGVVVCVVTDDANAITVHHLK